MSKAIVTLAVGEAFASLWQSKARPSWERYAARHGYELIVLEEPLDTSPLGQRPMSWQKLLALSHPRVAGFERVLWIDGDVIINDASAPCAVSQTPPDRVGAVQDLALLSHPSLAEPFERANHWNGTNATLAQEIYRRNGLAAPAPFILNCGVLVLSRSHRELLEQVYRAAPQGPYSYYEQVGLSHALLSRGLYHPISPRFNALWLEYRHATYPFVGALPALLPLCIAVALRNAYFLHFAGFREDMLGHDPNLVAGAEGIGVSGATLRGLAAALLGTAERLENRK